MPDPTADRAPFGVPRLAHLCLPVPDPHEAAAFAAGMAGLPYERHDATRYRSRADAMAWRLAWTRADAASAVGIELDSESALEAAIPRLRACGAEVAQADAALCEALLAVRAAVAHSPSGQRVELVVRPQVRAARFRPLTDTGVCGLGPVGLRSRDIARDLAFWTAGIGARVADRVGDITYLRLSERHHDLALYPSRTEGVLYATLDVDGFDALMADWYALREAGIAIHHGPGREAASGHRFVRFAAPGSTLLAFGWGMDRADAVSPRPRQFALEPAALCAWGSRCTAIVELDAGQVVPLAQAVAHPGIPFHSPSGKVSA